MRTCQEGAEILAARHHNCLALSLHNSLDITACVLLQSLTGESDKCCLLQGNGSFWHSLQSACSAHQEASTHAMLPDRLLQLCGILSAGPLYV